ncbi:choice-of-anchor L domain-containing protein [Epilithonimonas sp. UC225_85]|uniref:choice-of-anchor L domain-containing protein n=1 Tax=Epilithonimonas sp. UC225_85 TaxID=3350167 RepID=UPI0036D39574
MKHYKFFRFLLCCVSLIFINYSQAQNISVDTSLNAQDLVTKFIGAQNASCITVSNVSVSGWNFGGTDLSYGYFDRNGSVFDIDEGIILSTGKALEAAGPNGPLQSNYDSNWQGDQDLIAILTQSGLPTDNILNATSLEFDFESLQSDKISFDYMFLSEEYRPSNCQYSDAFAFLIKKANTTDPYQNIALVPGTNTPVTSLSINGATNCPRNIDYFGGFNGTVNSTNFNGQTKVLKAITTVQKGVKYHIKLVIADHGDSRGLYDSAVFLKAGSFTGNINIGNDLTLDNADPLCKNTPYRIQPNPALNDPSAQYFWFKDGQPITGIPLSQSYYDVINDEGNFSVNVVLGSGCRLAGNVKIEKAPVAQIDSSPILVCDYDFNGTYSAVLSNFDRQIVRNYEPGVFNVEYSLTPSGPALPDSEFVFTQNPQTLYARVGTYSCTPDIYPVQFYFGTKLTVNSIPVYDICDDDISGSQDFNLADYISLITNETGVTATYFATEAQARAGGNSTIPSLQTINSNKTFYIRIDKSGNCPNYKEIKFNFKQPKKSTILKDQTICKNTTTTLDAGSGFTAYEWNTGAKTQSIANVPAGDYWVKLTFNGCVYQQFVKVSEAEDPVIDNILIEGTTITVLASGGTKPYRYALDKGVYQTSNIFTNVQLGTHTVYVQGADGCSIITKDFTLINIQNAITPNNDGVNDFVDYSSLLGKSEPRFEVYDRYGILVFKGDTNNQFIWNGTFNGRILPTSSYWYILEWNESVNTKRTQLSGWILLKNRN